MFSIKKINYMGNVAHVFDMLTPVKEIVYILKSTKEGEENQKNIYMPNI